MTKKIVLTSCEGCPHKDHRGGYGNPSYVPVCRNVNKNLGFKREVNSRGTGVTAVYDGKIPNWCTLVDDQEPLSSKAISIGDFLKMPNAYVISVDGYNIGHTATTEDVREDTIHFVGVDEIVTFKYQTEFVEHLFVFSLSALLYVSHDNYKKTPHCQHLYTLENVGGGKVDIELGFVTPLYKLEKDAPHE